MITILKIIGEGFILCVLFEIIIDKFRSNDYVEYERRKEKFTMKDFEEGMANRKK